MHIGKRLPLVTGLGGLLLAGCIDNHSGASENPAPGAQALDTLVVDDPTFDFATSEGVKLRLAPESQGIATPVEVRDAENRRLAAGAYLVPVELDLRLPTGAAPRLTVETGRGDEAAVQTVVLTAGQGTASF